MEFFEMKFDESFISYANNATSYACVKEQTKFEVECPNGGCIKMDAEECLKQGLSVRSPGGAKNVQPLSNGKFSTKLKR